MQALQELARYIRNTLPNPEAILQLHIKERAAGITFIWQGVEFFVNTSLYAFEVRGHTLYITGLSTLLQSVLSNRNASQKWWAMLCEQLGEAETVLRDERLIRRGVEMIRHIREAALQLALKPGRGEAPSPLKYPSKSPLPAAA
jgi:hypothetical protein